MEDMVYLKSYSCRHKGEEQKVIKNFTDGNRFAFDVAVVTVTSPVLLSGLPLNFSH
jgi:hypothetical protein